MRHTSIRFRIFALFTLSMAMVLALGYFIIRTVTYSEMKRTLSDYLMSAVNANANKLTYKEDMADGGDSGEAESKESGITIAYGNGSIIIDSDFLEILNDVQSGLYTHDGQLLYGDGSLAQRLDGEAFTGSRIYEKVIDGETYIIYDRRLSDSSLEGLWIRGLVPLTRQRTQMNSIAESTGRFIPVLLLVIIIMSMIATYGILQPIRRMEQTATQIMDGDDLSRRIELGDNGGSAKGGDELSHLADSYNAMFDRLEASFAREKKFTSDASHELRTPLAVIAAESEHALSRERTGDEYRHSISVIKRQSARMQQLVEDMLYLARIGQGVGRYPFSDLDMSDLVRGICSDMERISYRGIELVTDIADDIHIRGNRDLLERMIINLLDNSFKYGRDGGTSRLVLACENEYGVVLSVSDNGIGMSDDTKEHIFDRFYRGSEAREGAGFGLGLSLVYDIAQLHSAALDVDSTTGEGSTFTVRFSAVK